MAFTMYPGLTQSAIAAIDKHASAELKNAYLPKMIAGTWSGTMNLTEPHCGTDLGLLKTKAVPQSGRLLCHHRPEDFHLGRRTGHDRGTSSIWCWRASKALPTGTHAAFRCSSCRSFIPDASGNPGERNGVSCGSIEHKMGIHANSTCVMNHTTQGAGWSIEANRGLNAMFVMMNKPRLGVANRGLSQSESGLSRTPSPMRRNACKAAP